MTTAKEKIDCPNKTNEIIELIKYEEVGQTVAYLARRVGGWEPKAPFDTAPSAPLLTLSDRCVTGARSDKEGLTLLIFGD
uniref:Uncharacterized protein n=1 Tax=Romanomermis culicivorax TaxID=13658 RepID=A0A915JDJ7_ROMCU